MEALVRDPDGRIVSLQASLPSDVTEPDHHDWYWLGARATLQVTDVTAVLEVLVGTLGWTLYTSMGDPATFAILGAGGATLGLTQSSAPAVPHDIASVYVDVQGVDALHARCAAAAIPVTNALTTHPYGQRDFVVRLPSGHQIAFGERVG